MTSIWWIRRDLRLAANAALQAARAAGPVIPVFILDPRLLARPAARRQAFLFAGLHALDAALRQRGSYLVVRKGDPLRELHDLLAEAGASAIFAEEDFTPFARKRDSQVSQALPLHLLPGETVQHPGLLLKKDGTPYTVYSPYSRKWKARLGPIDLIPPPESIHTPAGVRSEPLPAAASDPRFPAGEEEALTRLEEFTHRKIHSYAGDRDRVDLDGTSALSPYLRFGMLGIRRAVAAAMQPGGEGAAAWLNELIWREFYIQMLYHSPRIRRQSFDRSLARIPWRDDPDEFEAWKSGETGVPIVDAAMRQLEAEMRQLPGVRNMLTTIGADSQKRVDRGSIVMELKPIDQRKQSQQELMQVARRVVLESDESAARPDTRSATCRTRRRCRARSCSTRRSRRCPPTRRTAGKDACRCRACAASCRVTGKFTTPGSIRPACPSIASRRGSTRASCSTKSTTCSGACIRRGSRISRSSALPRFSSLDLKRRRMNE